MSEASYTAWDDNLYEWPPPDGWYQASDRKWWPEGTGPVEGEVSAVTSDSPEASQAAASPFDPQKTSALPAGGSNGTDLGTPTDALKTSSVPAAGSSANGDSDESDDDPDFDSLPNIDDVFMSSGSGASDDLSTPASSSSASVVPTGATTTSAVTASAPKAEENVSGAIAEETAEVESSQPVEQAQTPWSNPADFDPDATQIVDPAAADLAAAAAVQPTTIGPGGPKQSQPAMEIGASTEVVEQPTPGSGWSGGIAAAQAEATQISGVAQTGAVAKAPPVGEQVPIESQQVATPRAPTASPQTVPSHSPNPSEHQVQSPAPVAPQPQAVPRVDVNQGGMVGGAVVGGAIGESVGFVPELDYGQRPSADAHYQQPHGDGHQTPNPNDRSRGAGTAHLNQFQNQGSVPPVDGFGLVQEQTDFHHNDYDNHGQGVDPQWQPNAHDQQYRIPPAQHPPEEVETKSSGGRRGIQILIGLLAFAALAALGFLAWNLINNGGTGISDGGQSEEAEATGPGSIGEAYPPGTDVSVFYPDADTGEERRWVVKVADPVVDASERLVTGSGLNPPPDGEIYALLRINAKYQGGPVPGNLGDLRFTLVDPEGDVYTQADANCPAGQEGIDIAAQLAAAEEEDGNLCWIVPAETLDRLVFGVEASGAVGRVHLQVQPVS